jgi:hypothetical protein
MPVHFASRYVVSWSAAAETAPALAVSRWRLGHRPDRAALDPPVVSYLH